MWVTSTPLSFVGDSGFFCRDSGLICKTIQNLGLPCKNVMPLPAYPADLSDDLIRTDVKNLTRSEWWKSIGADKVVLYTWGDSKYRYIAEAVRNSGAKIFINLDSSGIFTPNVTPLLYYHSIMGQQYRRHGLLFGGVTGVLSCSIRSLAYRFYMPFVREPGRIAHLKTATAIGSVNPNALALWRLWARKYAPELVARMHLVPNPVVDTLKYDPAISKQDMVMAVGRWDDEEPKRPALLAGAISEAARRRSSTEFHIYGNPGRILREWYSCLNSEMRKRIYLHGKVPHETIQDNLKRSRICLCSSSHEGSHVSSEEALCSGASIVAPLRRQLNAMCWYISHDSGQLSVDDSVHGLAETLLLELEAWDMGHRDPVEISRYWRSNLSASAVVNKIRELLS